MINKVSRRLLMLNSLVYVTVLTFFAVSTYTTVARSFLEDEQRRLTTLTDAVISSIEPAEEEEEEGEAPMPDILQAPIGRPTDTGFAGETLQWYSPTGQRLAQKGELTVLLPFNPEAKFQTLAKEHIMLLTRPVVRDGQLMGYLRAAISLADHDRYQNKFAVGLFSGWLLAICVAVFTVIWLVKQSLKPVQANMDKLKQFSSDASHELKNPLMAIKANASVALKYDDQMRSSDREKFTAILNATEQMIRTTSDLLSLASAESQTLGGFTLTDLSEAVKDAWTNNESLAGAKQIKLDCELAPHEYAVAASYEDLHSVLNNIIENAIKYSDRGATVQVQAAQAGRHVDITVSDSGQGISEEELPFVFDRFWRSDKARSHSSGGNGLGLSIVKSIVERCGGEINISSRLNHGTTCRIKLPSAQNR